MERNGKNHGKSGESNVYIIYILHMIMTYIYIYMYIYISCMSLRIFLILHSQPYYLLIHALL
jgi:hypothetical protein